jgi:hypothetical protein
LDRPSGKIEFGAAVDLVTTLEEGRRLDDDNVANTNVANVAASSLIDEWLLDGRGIALSIWDADLITELSPTEYRLETMPLRFVTLDVRPTVHMDMWTQPPGPNKAGRLLPPIFKLQSRSVDVTVRSTGGPADVLLSVDDLGLDVEVVGDLRPTPDGRGVQGKICFQTTGVLPLPLRVVPEPVLKLAASTISDTVTRFAVSSFQAGARARYDHYKRQRRNP